MSKYPSIEALLRDSDMRCFLKELIFSHTKHILELQCQREAYLHSPKFSWLGNSAQKLRQWIFDTFKKEGRKLAKLMREQKQMDFIFGETQKRLCLKNTSQQEHEYATRKVQIIDVVTHFLIEIHHSERNIHCPLCESTSRCFTIYPEGNSFRCSECKACGGPVSFVMEYLNCDFQEAVQIIADHI